MLLNLYPKKVRQNEVFNRKRLSWFYITWVVNNNTTTYYSMEKGSWSMKDTKNIIRTEVHKFVDDFQHKEPYGVVCLTVDIQCLVEDLVEQELKRVLEKIHQDIEINNHITADEFKENYLAKESED